MAKPKLSDDEQREAFKRTLRAMPGYPWLPCPICVREGFIGTGGCDHTGYERAVASGMSFTNDTAH